VNNGGEQHHEEYLNIHPHRLVPALDTTDSIITQSIAIIEYLEECYPLPALLPKEPRLRAKIRAFALAIAADTHPLNNLRVLRYLTDTLGVSDEEKNTWYHHWLRASLDGLETMLTNETPSTQFAYTNTPSLADICLIPQLYNARRFHFALDNYPRLLAIEKTCLSHPAFQAAYPKETAPV
jgi:maleylacetoacetate isomerase